MSVAPSLHTFELNINIPEETTQNFTLTADKTTIGNSSTADISLHDLGLQDIHYILRIHNGILSLHHLGNENTYLNKQLLQHGKMYILENGDKIRSEEFELFINALEKIDQQKTDFGQNHLSSHKKASKKDSEKTSTLNEHRSIKKRFFLIALKEKISTWKSNLFKANFVNKVTGKVLKKKSKVPRPSLVATSRGSNKDDRVADSKLPGVLIRIYGFIINLLLAYIIVYLLLPFLHLPTSLLTFITDQIDPQEALITVLKSFGLEMILGPYLQSFSAMISTNMLAAIFQTLDFYLLYVVIDLIFHGLLGSSLPYFLLRIKSDDSFVMQRVKGLLRSLIGAITLPLIIFDLPVIFRKRTLKEILSFSHLYYSDNFIKMLSIILIFPVIFVLCLLSPLLRNLQTSFELSVTPEIDTQLFKQKKDSNTIFDKIKFIPQLQANKQTIIIYDSKKEQGITFAFSKTLALAPILALAQNGNPLFPLLFPALKQHLTLSTSTIKTIYGQDEKNEVEQLMRAALLINFNLLWTPREIPQLLLESGPFINGYVLMRDALLKELDLLFTPIVSFPKYRTGVFIQFSNPQKSVPPVILLPLDSLRPQLIEITYQKDSNYLAHLFLTQMVNQIHWGAKRQNSLFQNQFEETLYIVGSAQALLTEKTTKIEQSKIATSIFQYHKMLLEDKEAIKQSQYRHHLQQIWETNINFIQTLDKSGQNQLVSSLIKELQKLDKSLKKWQSSPKK